MSEWFKNYGYNRITINPSFFFGARPEDNEDLDLLLEEKVDIVFSLCKDSEYEKGQLETIKKYYKDHHIEFYQKQVEDFSSFAKNDLQEIISFLVDKLENDKVVYLHCRAGMQRSATVACGVVSQLLDISIDEALQEVKKRRSLADPMQHQWHNLEEWARERSATM